MSENLQFDADVLVVGGGPVGLSLSLALGLRDNRVIMIERDGSRGPQPRAKTLNMRSLAHLRRWGIADAVRAASPTPEDLPTDIIFQTRLYGRHIATLPNIYFRGNSHSNDPRFCEASEWIPQHIVEDVIREKTQQLRCVDQRYGTELLDFVQDADGVTSRLRTEGGISSVRTKFIVGADGGSSGVRDAVGGKLEGRYAYDCNYNMVLRIPELNQNPPENRGIMHWLINEDSPGIMGPIGDLWYVAKKLPRGVSGMTDDEIGEYLTGIVGKKVDFEVMALDPWFAHELISDTYRDRRAFIAGDACQLRPPFGGYGMNMGIGDAADLAWKLDAVLHKWGGEQLLESYEQERRQVHKWVIEEAVANYAVLSADLLRADLEADTPAGDAARAALAEEAVAQKRSEFHTIGLVLGYHYGGSPVIDGGDDLPAPETEEYDPVAVPGKLAPHLWLEPGLSLYDHLGPGMTLLIKQSGRDSAAAFQAAAGRLGVPLTILELPGDAGKLYPKALTLARPDEHVAWMGEHADESEAEEVLQLVTGQKNIAVEGNHDRSRHVDAVQRANL